MQDRYRHAEEEYFKLRGQFDTGRLTQEQFDAALRQIMVQDEQGRHWMLGADSGKWYFYDGTKWVQADPYAGSRPPAAPPAGYGYVPPPPVSAAYGARRFPLVPILVLVAIIVLAAAAFLVFANRDRLFTAQRQQQITPILPPTITRAPVPTTALLVPTLPPPTAPPVQQPTIPVELPTLLPTSSAPLTPTIPDITIVVVTSAPGETPLAPETVVPIATLEPTFAPTATLQPTLQPTAQPTVQPTAVPPTVAPTPNFPPNVYVTALTLDPPAPKRNQEINFTATFVNTTGETRSFDWLVLIYDPNKPGANKGFGESFHTGINVPPGESQFTVTYPGVKGAGGCVSFYAQAAWQDADKNRTLFPNPDGGVTQVGFDVCPVP